MPAPILPMIRRPEPPAMKPPKDYMKNCKQCGAYGVKNDYCEYCGKINQ